MMLNTEQSSVDFGFAIGEHVRILSGPLENFSGVVEDATHDMHLVAARADITARTNHSLKVEIPLEQTQTRLTKALRRYSLKLGSIEIPLWVGKPPK